MSKSIFAQNLVKARKHKQWSQDGAAKSIGIKRATLASYEESRAFPPADTLLKIAEAYQIKDLQAFMSDTNYFEPKISSEILFDRYTKLTWWERKAINAILRIE